MSSLALMSRNKLLCMRPLLVSLLNPANGTSSSVVVRGAHYWNKDWMPGPYPKTEDEKRAAAKKYGMLREDYEPYPDDGTGYGDYPKLPLVSADSRNPHEAYTADELKRHFGEPMHVDCDLVGEDRFNVNERTILPRWQMYAIFFGWMSLLAGLFMLGEEYRICVVKQMPKQFPGDGKIHYTFETE